MVYLISGGTLNCPTRLQLNKRLTLNVSIPEIIGSKDTNYKIPVCFLPNPREHFLTKNILYRKICRLG